jgi:glycosyltransferase involved in cell wall biosynthesis
LAPDSFTDLSDHATATPDDVRVLAVSANAPSSPGFRVRVQLLRNTLEHSRVFVDPLTFFSDEEAARFTRGGIRQKVALATRARSRMRKELLSASFGTAVALIQRQADKFPSLELECLASDGHRLVWDVDDALWLDTTPAAGGHRLALLKRSRKKARWLATRADHVVAATEVLASYLERYTENLTVVPSLVDPDSYAPRVHSDDDEEFVIGWVGSPTTALYLRRLQGVLAEAVRTSRRPLRLLVVGGEPPPIPDVEVETIAWSSSSERAALARMDVGVMPLPDTPWTRGKAAYKALVYMAAGIPVIADDVGVSSPTISDGGLIVRNPEEWVVGLRTLEADEELRARLGAAGRARVEREYSVSRWAPTIASLLRGEDCPAEIAFTGMEGK